MVALLSPCKAAPLAARRAAPARRAVVTRADAGFIGSPTNLIMVTSTAAFLGASRWGLAPSASRIVKNGKFAEFAKVDTGVLSSDPSGFTASDVLVMGSVGHIFGVGVVLGLKAVGAI